MPSHSAIWTIGHSNHDIERFAALVSSQRIEFLVDVRSYPYSKFAPHFNREHLRPAMEARDVRYVFLGTALGGRPRREDHYDETGHALYSEMAAEPEFQTTVDHLLEGAHAHRMALLCSCGQPEQCHRRLLVGKVLCDRGAELRHILPDGSIEIERSVALPDVNRQAELFGHDYPQWRSTRSVSHRRRLSASSVD
jgi:uncharacterized protein (DUF488 family)